VPLPSELLIQRLHPTPSRYYWAQASDQLKLAKMGAGSSAAGKAYRDWTGGKAKKESKRLLPWQILVELRDHTGFANWKENTGGWGTLKKHRDPSQCAGVTVDDSVEITKIDLSSSNLAGCKPDNQLT
jgi:hypothetical protein